MSEASSSSSADLSKKLKPKKDSNAVVKRGPKKRQKVRRYVDDDVNDVTDAFPFEETSETSEEEQEAVDEDIEVPDTTLCTIILCHFPHRIAPRISCTVGSEHSLHGLLINGCLNF